MHLSMFSPGGQGEGMGIRLPKQSLLTVDFGTGVEPYIFQWEILKKLRYV